MAITLIAFRNGASLLAKAFGVGFVDWLDGIVVACGVGSVEGFLPAEPHTIKKPCGF